MKQKVTSMRIRERVTALTVAAVTVLTLASTQLAGVASADDVYGEYTVGGKIEEAYTATGGPDKWGNPLIAESPAFQGGRFQTFEKNVSFYWKANVAGGTAHFVGGAIRGKWASLRYERGVLGWPLTNEIDVPGRGKRQNFQGGNVYYSSAGGTRTVWGGILARWSAKGGSTGFFGFPVSDEYRNGRGWAQDFNGGTLFFP